MYNIMKIEKKCIIKVGGQDNTGLLNVETIFNNIGVDFEFNRVNTGLFECVNFDVSKHRATSVTNKYLYLFDYSTEDFLFMANYLNITNGTSDNSDSVFEFGGWIIIEEVQKIEYTPYELSKIAYCKSVLLGSGSEKLIELSKILN